MIMMTLRRVSIANLLLYLFAAIAIGFGLIYITRQKLMPYHLGFLGIEWNEIHAQIQMLVLGMMHLIGFCFVVLGIAMIMLIKTDSSNRHLNILGLSILFLILAPLQYFTVMVGHGSPWWLVSVLILILSAGLLLRSACFKNRVLNTIIRFC